MSFRVERTVSIIFSISLLSTLSANSLSQSLLGENVSKAVLISSSDNSVSFSCLERNSALLSSSTVVHFFVKRSACISENSIE